MAEAEQLSRDRPIGLLGHDRCQSARWHEPYNGSCNPHGARSKVSFPDFAPRIRVTSEGDGPMTEHIKVTQDGAVLEIIFGRPEKKNALSNAMYGAATQVLNDAQNNQAVRVVLFGAEGDAFTAGIDLTDFASVAEGKRDELQAHHFIEALAQADKPIVAAVSGLAVGVGTTMQL